MIKVAISWTETLDCSAILEVKAEALEPDVIGQDVVLAYLLKADWFRLLIQQTQQCMCTYCNNVEHRQLLSCEVIEDDDNENP